VPNSFRGSSKARPRLSAAKVNSESTSIETTASDGLCRTVAYLSRNLRTHRHIARTCAPPSPERLRLGPAAPREPSDVERR
jgi:hypothetical protein